MSSIVGLRQWPFAMLLAASGVASGCEAGSSVATSATASTATATAVATVTTTPTATADRVDLSAVVVSASTAPSGLQIEHTDTGLAVLLHKVISGRTAEFVALEGFLDGMYTEASGAPGVLLSLALAFDSPAHAHAAFALFLDELHSDRGYRAGSGVDADLGEEGTCTEFDNPAIGGLHESACLWRHGRLVLISGGTLSPETIHDVAEGMDARAD
jgi:hypothetical protein